MIDTTTRTVHNNSNFICNGNGIAIVNISLSRKGFVGVPVNSWGYLMGRITASFKASLAPGTQRQQTHASMNCGCLQHVTAY